MKQFHFSKASRLLTADQYQRVFQKADSKANSQQILLLARKQENPDKNDAARVGLVISKKSAKRAVDRNRIKRIVRDSFRHKQLNLKGLDIVVLSRKGITEMQNKDLQQLLDRLWSRLLNKRA